MIGRRRRRGGVALLGILGVLALTAARARAQAPADPRPLPFVHLAGSAALSFSGCDFRCAVGEVGAAAVRAEVPVADHVAPWVSYTSFWVLNAHCHDGDCNVGSGDEVMAGATFDLAGERARARVHPYLGAGLGRVRMDRYPNALAPHAAAGLLWRALPILAPQLELAWERYPHAGGSLMMTFGLQATVPRVWK